MQTLSASATSSQRSICRLRAEIRHAHERKAMKSPAYSRSCDTMRTGLLAPVPEKQTPEVSEFSNGKQVFPETSFPYPEAYTAIVKKPPNEFFPMDKTVKSDMEKLRNGNDSSSPDPSAESSRYRKGGTCGNRHARCGVRMRITCRVQPVHRSSESRRRSSCPDHPAHLCATECVAAASRVDGYRQGGRHRSVGIGCRAGEDVPVIASGASVALAAESGGRLFAPPDGGCGGFARATGFGFA